jgi:hypothetical protein
VGGVHIHIHMAAAGIVEPSDLLLLVLFVLLVEWSK